MKWYYKDICMTREQAERRILSLNFVPSKTTRGWELQSPNNKKERFHIVPASPDCMEVHEDTHNHKVKKSKKSEYKCRRIIKHLNKHNKLKVFIKKLFLTPPHRLP